MIGQSIIGKKSCVPMNNVSSCFKWMRKHGPQMKQYNPSSWWGKCYGLGPLILEQHRLNITTIVNVVGDQAYLPC